MIYKMLEKSVQFCKFDSEELIHFLLFYMKDFQLYTILFLIVFNLSSYNKYTTAIVLYIN